MKISGLHHVTAIAGDPQRNLDFYVGVLGLRLVKRTVNFDDPGSYHFYFGDERGSPGTILTFFPWPGARRGLHGAGQIEATAFAVAPESVGYWLNRLKQHGVTAEKMTRFGGDIIRFADPDGLLLELVAFESVAETGAHDAVQTPNQNALRGFHGVSAALTAWEPTARLLTETFGYRQTEETENRFRFMSASGNAPGGIIDLRLVPGGSRGSIAVGSVHHVAFRAENDEAQRQWREKLLALGFNVTQVLDRVYFHSIYFREPGGILFEIATDSPGFAIDETVEELGSTLRLPPWMESARAELEEILPPITVPARRH